MIAVSIVTPSPFMANAYSTATEPPSVNPIIMPAIVMTGRSAFLMTCRHITTLLPRPLAIAVRT